MRRHLEAMAAREQVGRTYGMMLAHATASGPELTEEEETVYKEYANVTLLLGEGLDQGAGRLFVTTRYNELLAADHKQL